MAHELLGSLPAMPAPKPIPVPDPVALGQAPASRLALLATSYHRTLPPALAAYAGSDTSRVDLREAAGVLGTSSDVRHCRSRAASSAFARHRSAIPHLLMHAWFAQLCKSMLR